MNVAELYEETIAVPRAVRFPIELIPPDGFDAARPETWPRVPGRLEHVEGRLLFMPPCGDLQQDTVTDVVITLGAWLRSHLDYVLGTNEVGMRLRNATRAADAAVWRRAAVAGYSGGFRRVAPVLAVEVSGVDEPASSLRQKADWYCQAGVASVWIVIPESREVIVVTPAGETRHGQGDRIPSSPELPGLEATVDELFVQIARR